MEDLNKALTDALQKYNESLDFLSLQKSLSQFAAADFKKPSQSSQTDQKLAILSNYSTQFVGAALKPSLITRGIWPEIYEDEYDSWEMSSFKADSALYAFKPDIVLFLLSSIQLAFSGRNEPAEIAARICMAVKAVKSNSGAKIVITLPEPLSEERSNNDWAYEWRQKLIQTLAQDLPPDCVRISLDSLIREVGADVWYSHRYYVSSKLPFHPGQTKRLANFIADILADLVAPRVKLIIVDLDNTMWGGIVGETGTEGVDLNPQDRGYGHLRLQRMLQDLNRRGVLLAIASKNNFDDAIDVFNKRPEMILKESQFSAIKINWDAKSKNITDILRDLNLSTAGVVFLDDMPFERAEVRQALPGLIIPELGKDPVNWVDELLDLGIFSRSGTSNADKARVDLYKIEKTRQDEKANFKNEKEFLSSLNLVLKVKDYAQHKDRVLELFAKTNQFNVTTRRYNRSQLDALVDKGGKCFVFELEDKFGSYGIISVFLTLPESQDKFKIDAWLMSCRVINRRVENAVLSYSLDELKKRGIRKILAEYVPTAKNKIVSDLYERLGFKPLGLVDQSQIFELDFDQIDTTKVEHHCEIIKTTDGIKDVQSV